MASSTRVTFPNKLLPYLLLAPQLAITAIFFYWPASQAIYQSVLREDPFGLSTQFVGLGNFRRVISDPNYLNSLHVTVVFSIATALIAMALALLLAVMADKVIRGKGIYRTLMIWPYAVAPAIAGMLWLFLFNPSMGTLAYLIRSAGYNWDPLLNGNQAMVLVVSAASWKQISYNFLFFVAGLQSILVNLILGDSAAQSVILMVIVIALTAIQFRYVERKVHYG
jgi:sn-glycerol 3-phosphate transport system permease protein